MDSDDIRVAAVAAELSQLMLLKQSVKFASDPAIEQCITELAREMATLTPSDPRRAEIVAEIMRLVDLSKQTDDDV
jgi:hypothetical protein